MGIPLAYGFVCDRRPQAGTPSRDVGNCGDQLGAFDARACELGMSAVGRISDSEKTVQSVVTGFGQPQCSWQIWMIGVQGPFEL